MYSVADVLSSVKGVVSWLNRQPFEGVEQYDSLKSNLVELSIRLATIAQRDMFAENQATVILQSCLKLANISDKIIQECNDPLIIQPASLDIATIKKKADDEWGVMLQSSYHGVHQVSGVRALSPAHQCGKLQEGDELVQVSYQTVVGWAPHKVAAIMQECPVEVILTVKKRPCHSNTVTQIYFKPFRLPSKKRTYSPWATSVMTSPRDDLKSIPNLQLPPSVGKSLQRTESKESRPRSLTPPPANNTPPHDLCPHSGWKLNDARNTTSDSEAEDSDLEDDPFFSDSDVCGSSPISARLYHPKPRAPVQRRATIPGATTRPSFSFDKLLQDVRWQRGGRSPDGPIPSDPDLRATAGVEQRAARPHTCIGTEKKDRMTGGSEVAVVKEEGAEGDVGSIKNGALETFSTSEARESSSQEQSKETGEEKRVVNVIPLPPRKPTGQGITPTVLEPHSQHDHGGDGKAGGGKEAVAGTPSHQGRRPSQPAFPHSSKCLTRP
ncbi:Connector enhancer of kinase suppressor of ras 2 [Penaeus vannamei]|uniref:Connector enhancer of kinase suppressor of ras 2 n=1 Tax=Penaeus vannamei TaxID=6689 RepID=A0A3R7M572_PENVA|nr:Connector enhancer of kinase suppressor of ras 2 [Penaeus vannamei]